MKNNNLKFHYITGSCPNCGANQFRFNEEKQTLVCEYCDATVYQSGKTEDVPKMKFESEQLKVEQCAEPLCDDDSVDCSTDYQPDIHISDVLLMGFVIIAAICFFTNDTVIDYMASIDLLALPLPVQILFWCAFVVGGTIAGAGDTNN
jgi:ribosomal protein S27E